MTLPILLLFCLFLVIFLSIGLRPFMMSYPEFFFLLFSLFVPCYWFLSVCFTVPVRGTDSVTKTEIKKKSFVYLQILALEVIHTNTYSQQH